MKIKYRKSDNVIVSMGNCDFLHDVDYEVEEVNADIPIDCISNYKRVDGGIEKRPQSEIDAEITSEKNTRKNAKREVINAIASVTGLTKSKIIKGLKMALDDGNDD